MKSQGIVSSSPKASRLLLAISIVAALFGFGCSGGGDQEAPAAAGETTARLDICAFLTASDVEGVLGNPAGAPQAGGEGLGQCIWGDATALTLTLREGQLRSFDDFVFEFGEEFGGEDPPRDRFYPVEGIGDWAMFIADDHLLRVFRGQEVLELSSPSADETQLVELARLSLPRLQ